MSMRRSAVYAAITEHNMMVADLEEVQATIERVRELHWPNSDSFDDRDYSCGHCGHPYPCDTIRALDGGDE